MFLSWWRSLINLAHPKNEEARNARRRRLPRRFRSAMNVEQLEDRLVPAGGGKANLFLNVGSVSPAVTVTAARSTIVPVYIDFDTISLGTSSGGISSGAFYVLYDPAVLSISETPTAVGPDIKLGSLLSGLSSNYNLVVSGTTTVGVVSIGLNHTGSNYLTGSPTGHLIELDFHVVSSTPALNNSSLLDLQGTYTDPNTNNHVTTVLDKANNKYTFAPVPLSYTGALTQPGVTAPSTFSPTDADPTDVSIQIAANPPNLAPTAVADTYSMAPNNSSFFSTMTVTGQGSGVLATDTPTSNGPAIAVLPSGVGVTVTTLAAGTSAITSATESGMVVTITTAAAGSFMPGEAVGITVTNTPGYNGTYDIATVISSTQFTYTTTALALAADTVGGTAVTTATTIYSAPTTHGTVWLNSADGSFAYSPAANYSGTDSFAYQAVDAVSNTASAAATVTIYVGGVMSIPQNLATTGPGKKLVVPVNILNPNPANSGGLANATIGINFDTTVFNPSPSAITISEGTVNGPQGANWGNFIINTNTPGKIVITTGDTSGGGPVTTTTGGSLALITFNVIGFPSTGTTSVINLSAASPQVSQLATAGSGVAANLPMAFPTADNTNFNGAPGADDGLVTFPVNTNVNTTMTMSDSVAGVPKSTIVYGTPLTLTATVQAKTGTAAPTAGSVDFLDVTTSADLGTVTTETVSGSNAIFTLVTGPNLLQVIPGGNLNHNIQAFYLAGDGFNGSGGTLTGGINVTPAPLTITASPNNKVFDNTTTAAAQPTVTGLIGTDFVDGMAEVYLDKNAGTGKTLSVTNYTVEDNNVGNDYTVTLATTTTGIITPAPLTITAATNTKVYNSTTAATGTPTVSGLFGSDTVTGLAEVYSDKNAGTGKTLSVSAYNVNDGNGGKNYTVVPVNNTTGVITKASVTISVLPNTKVYDATTTAATAPTVTGLIGGDTATGLAEAYADKNTGSSKTLSVSAYTINDGNGGNNYTVLTGNNTAGLISKAALTITAIANTKNFDNSTSAAAIPTVSGLHGSDTVTGMAEVYTDPTLGTGKTLSVSAYTVADGNNGNNYTVTTATNTSGVIVNGQANTTTAVATSQASVAYGTPVTFTITVTASSGAASPTGTVEVFDNGSHDLGAATLSGSNGLVDTFTLTTLPKTLIVTSPLAHAITANFTASGSFGSSVGTLPGGQTITPKAITVTAAANTKTYDSTTTASATPTVSGGLVGSDTVTGMTEAYTTANAGTGKTETVVGYLVNDGNGGNNYTVTTASDTTGVINKAALTITATTNTKTYDSTTTAAAKPTVAGLIGTDTVTGLVEAYATANAGSSKTLAVGTYTVNDGNSGGNYTVTTVTNTTGVINKAALTITATTNTKTYDSKTTAAATPTVAGLQGSDTATGLAEVYANANAGTGKTLSVSTYLVNDANNGGNYTVTTVTNTTGVINTAALTITATTNTKTYDSKTSAAATPTVSGLQGNDTVTGLAEVYSDRNAGSGKTLSVSTYLVNDANNGGNYTVTTVTNTTGVINKAALTITASTNTKAFDGLTTAAATPTVAGLQGGDTVTGLSETYDNSNPGTGKTLTVNPGYTVNDGNSGNNYTVATATNVTGAITGSAASTTTVQTSQASVTYGTPVTFTITVSVTGGTISPTGSVEVFDNGSHDLGAATFLNSNGLVSTWTLATLPKTLNVTNPLAHVITANYTATGSFSNSAGTLVGGQTVTPKAITITASSNTKTYDSTTAATATPTVAGGLVGSDTITGLGEAYISANVGTGKTETVTTYTVNDGNGGNNYTVTTAADTTGVINKATLTITATTNTKTYDSKTSAAATPTVSGLIGNDTVTGLAEAYATASAGSSKTLSVSGYTVSDGNGGGNYAVTTVANTTGVINKAALTITATTNTKTYDSTTTAGAAPTVTGLIGSDTVTGLAEVYATAAAGSGKTLSVSAYTVNDANSGGNYTVTAVTNTTGVINKAALTITAATNTKTYDSTTAAAAVPTVTSGLIGNDTVTGLAEVYLDRNAGTGKSLAVSGYTVNDGNGGGNYTITTVNNTTGVINKAALTISAVTNTKTFDGTTTAAGIPTVAGLQGGDTVTGLSEAYADSNPGTGKTLSVNAGYTVNDGNGGNNYTVTTATNTTGVIGGVIGTSTTVNTSQASVMYGTSVTFTITVTASGGTGSPTGSVEVFDNGSHDLGAATFLSSSGVISTWTLSTLPKTLNVTNPLAHTITAAFTATVPFGNSFGTLAGGQTVTPRAITVTATSNTKSYDSTTTAAAVPTVSGLVSGDTVTGMGESYSDAKAGTGKTLTVNGGYTVNDGDGGLDYTVTTAGATTGVITKAALTITAATNTKAYDSTTTAGAIPTVAGLQGGDTVTGLSEAYTSASAGTGKTLNVNAGYTVNDGNGGGNYTVTTVANTTGAITKGALTITANTNTKTYDSTTTAGAMPAVSGLQGQDTVSGLSEAYADAKAGVGKTLNVNPGFVVNDGSGGNNYAVTLVANTTGVINKATVTITAATNTKTYDSTTTASAIPTPAGLIGSDFITGLSEVYTDANAGTGKTLVVKPGFTINDGNGGNNYSVATVANTTGVINKAALTITATTNTKNFDGTTTALAKPSVAGLVGGDNVSGLAEAYATSSPGTGITLSVSSYTINDGNGGNNYSVTTVNDTTGAIILQSTNVTITNTTGAMLEPPEGTKVTYTFTVSLGQPLQKAVTVNYSTLNGTARAGTDYSGITGGSVVIPAGATSVPLSITILGDAPEQQGGPTDEFFSVNLNWAQSVGNTAQPITGATATADIQQTFVPTVSIPATQTVHLSGGVYAVTVNLASTYPSAAYANAAGAVSVSYYTSNGTGKSGTNYKGVSGNLTIPAADFVAATNTVTIPITGIGAATGQTFMLNLGSASSNVALGGPTTSVVSMFNPQIAVGTPTGAAGGVVLTSVSQLTSVINAAEANWIAVGVKSSKFAGVQFQIGTIGKGVVGNTAGNVITIDAGAAGFGWFVDTTNTDFKATANPVELTAVPGTLAAGHMDLLTVVEHELGHVLGLDDVNAGPAPDSLMTATLPAGERRLPSSALIAVVAPPPVVSQGTSPQPVVVTLPTVAGNGTGSSPPTKAQAADTSALDQVFAQAASESSADADAIKQLFTVLGKSK